MIFPRILQLGRIVVESGHTHTYEFHLQGIKHTEQEGWELGLVCIRQVAKSITHGHAMRHKFL